MDRKYNDAQKEAILGLKSSWNVLVEVYELQRRAYKPILNLGDALDAAIADICFDRVPSMQVAERRFEESLKVALSCGMGLDELYEKYMRRTGCSKNQLQRIAEGVNLSQQQEV